MSVRGTTAVTLRGKSYVFLLTLGAQAEIEDGLKLDSINALLPMLEKMKAQAVLVAAAALAKGGGTPIDEETLRGLTVAELMGPVGEAILSVFQSDEPAGATEKKD